MKKLLSLLLVALLALPCLIRRGSESRKALK